MTPNEVEEYRALRATIRERGTTRIWIALAGFAVWSGLVVATAALAALPVAVLLPLLFLTVVFEAVHALHTGVERIGRYVQVFLEDRVGWEHSAMAYGTRFRTGGPDPLFAMHFWFATAVNFVPAVLAGPLPIEWGFVGAFHVAFAARIWAARHHARRQRALDLERFQQLKEGPPPGS
jgi:hypothetical protein